MSVSNVIYNVNVKSKFELFLNDDLCEAEPEELVRKINEDKKKKEVALKEAKKLKQGETKKPIVKSVPEPEFQRSEEKRNGEKAPRFQTDKRASSKPKNIGDRSTVLKPESGFEETNKEIFSRGGRVKRPINNTFRRSHGREFDRHSGSDKTGVKATEKRDGSGSHNWGSVKDIVELETEVPEIFKDYVVTEKPSETDVVATEVKKESEKTMTMSEWKALNKENFVISSKSAARPANNGEDVFSGMNVYKKRMTSANDSDTEVAIPDDDEIDSKGRRQIKLDLGFSGRSRRGGRTGGTGTRFNKEEKVNATTLDILINLNEDEFPSLK